MKTPYLGAEVTEEVITGINTTLDGLNQQLSFAVGLSPRDRQRLQNLGRERVQFVQLTLEHLQQNPALVPPYLDAEAVARNYGLHQDLQKILEKMNKVSRLIADTVHYTGAQAAKDALAYYSVAKRAAYIGIPGIEDATERMKVSLKKVNKSGGNSGDVTGSEPTGS